ncbi:RNA 2',3'-cyclic phosphodiesterase [Cellulomonas sp. ATA003]|uniref:RNA 2',3'-cyclic phosphodiesterase n=1 Tax=Cellulomonas sp. ATA003 TaxID=3073064 RepID=UPI0028739C0A|nr:RNA 2',3'-cyclic phosphodiesterase [Cellulomonas sp. ATA003]WNB84823.1 RNA 2',3'-cyclic phosphodiesterase [Cellulomonas sp. ATA003]
MRLFAAVQPPEHVLAHLERALAAVRGPDEDAGGVGPLRWAALEDRHVTLAFFGEVPDGAAPDLADGLAAIAAAHAPFRSQLRGAGVFDRRVFWIGVGGDVDALGALTAECVGLGEEVTGRTDSRVRSRSHLTVARVRSQARARPRPYRRRETTAGPAGPDRVAALSHALAVYSGPEWTVEDFALVSSRPGEGRGGGPAYTTEATLALGHASSSGT